MSPEIASRAGSYLAVWQDKRSFGTSLPVPSFEWETSSDIYGMRFDANGVLVAAEGRTDPTSNVRPF
ncbi:MAG TPA: hypothetical protein VGL24_01785 [Chthoniobacterales bacterium]